MTKLAEIREIKLNLAKFAITNEEWLCPSCEVWSNSVEWAISIIPKTNTIAQCPKCKYKVEV
jgi:hypothetical protein